MLRTYSKILVGKMPTKNAQMMVFWR